MSRDRDREGPKPVAPGPPPFLAVLGSCDLRCAWCNYEGVSAAASTAEVERVRVELERLRGAGHRRVGFGLYHTEPTRHPDLAAIVRLARELGFEEVTLSTSGVRLAERDYLAELRRAGLTCVGLTVVGLESELADLLLGCPGGAAAKVRAIENSVAEGLGLYVIVLLLRPVLRDVTPGILELGKLVTGPGRVLHGIVPDSVKGTPVARVEALWPRYDEVAWLVSQPELRRGFPVHSSDVPPCARARIPGMVGAQVERADLATAFVKPEAVCGACPLRTECLGVEPGYVAAYGDDFTVAAGPREPARPDLEVLRQLLATTTKAAAAASAPEPAEPVEEVAPRPAKAPAEVRPASPPAPAPSAPAPEEPAPAEPWQQRAAAVLDRARAGRGRTLAGYAVTELKLAPGQVLVQLQRAGDSVELYLELKAAASRYYKAGRRLAVSYRPATPPSSPQRRRLIAGLLQLLDDGA